MDTSESDYFPRKKRVVLRNDENESDSNSFKQGDNMSTEEYQTTLEVLNRHKLIPRMNI